MSENLKIYLKIAIIIALLTGAYAALVYVNYYSRSISGISAPNFWVSAEGRVMSLSDVAQFSFSVITQGGKNLTDLQAENSRKTNEAIEFVKSQNVEAKDIKTINYNIEPHYSSKVCNYYLESGKICPLPEIVGYTITNTVSVKVRNFEKISELLNGVVLKGANSVSGVHFTIDDPTNFQNQARAEAIKKAKEKAESIAQAAGFKLGRLISINEDNYPVYYNNFAYGMADTLARSNANFSSKEPVIEPGSNEITARVTLRYEIR